MVQFLISLARTTPVLLVLGDLHEIDEVGLDLIRYLAHLAANMPLLMVGALRDPDIEAAAQSRQMIEAMTRERLWLRIDLRCLSPHASAQLVRVMLPDDSISEGILAEIYEQSRGNPLFIRELIEGMSGDNSEPGRRAREPRLARRPAARQNACPHRAAAGTDGQGAAPGARPGRGRQHDGGLAEPAPRRRGGA